MSNCANFEPQFFPRLLLDLVAAVDQLQHALLVGHVAEIGAQHGVERLRDQLLDVAEPLDHRRRFLVVDMHHERQRQHRFVGIGRDQLDRFQRIVEVVALRAARDPVQDEVRGGHLDDHARRRVEGVLAGAEGRFPNAFFAFPHPFAVAELLAGGIGPLLPIEADHYSHVADRHHALGNHLDRGEPAVDEIGAVDQRHVLHAAPPARPQEGLDVLIVVMEVGLVLVGPHGRRDQFARRQRGTFVDRRDADLVGPARDDQRAEAAELAELVLPLLQALGIFQGKDAVLGDHVEQGDVDGVHAFAEDAPLAALLPAVGEELAGVLEIVAIDDFAQGLRRIEVFAAAGEDIADPALLDCDQRELVNRILPSPEAEVQPAAEDIGLVAGLAMEGDDRAFRQRAGARPEFFHDADAVVGDVARGQPGDEKQYAEYRSAVAKYQNSVISRRGKHGMSSLR